MSLVPHVPLHLHDYYSVLDGFSTPEEYMKRANDIGMTHLAQTNHGTLAGHRHFQRAAKSAGITPILGLEAYISPTDRFDKRSKAKRQDGTNIYNHIILLAQNERGLENLNLASEVAWNEGFYNKPRLDFEVLETYNSDLIVLSGCMNGLIAKAYERGDQEEALEWLNKFIDVFGDRFYIEIQDHNPAELNHYLLDLADKYNVKPVITDDCHYADPSQKWLEEAFLILSSNPKRNFAADLAEAQKMDILERFNYLYPERTMTFEKLDIFLADRELRAQNLAKQGIDRTDIFTNTNEIAARVTEYPYYVSMDTIPVVTENDPHEELVKLCNEGMAKRGLQDKQEYIDRLNHELNVIGDKKFDPYFIMVADAFQWAKDQGIFVGPGRGSSAGSLVCYVLEITEVDPLEFDLLFERFLDPSRKDWPDIDTDMEDTRRSEVKDYLEDKYGHVASIATFGFYKDRKALKDAARVMGVQYSEMNKLVKNFEGLPDNKVINEFEKSRDTLEFRKKFPDVMKLAKELRGRLVSMGMHAAGLIVSKDPISKYTSLESRKVGDKRIPTTGVDFEEADSIGLLKVDLLGLSNLRVIKDCVNIIRERHGKIINPWRLPRDDKKTYELLNKGLTAGVFQFEGISSTKLMARIGPKDFNDLVLSTALVRTGAWKAIGEDYVATRQGKKKLDPVHDIVKPFTEETLYFVVYQEQMMRMCTDLADMSFEDANKIRKITAKKKDPKLLMQYKSKFVNGASKNISKAKAEKLWESFEIAAEYMFVKSHAVAYMFIAYATAWLKANYTVEFMWALMKNEDEKDKITDYLLECKHLGISIKLPHVNSSKYNFDIVDNALQFGLSDIKGIKDTTASRVMSHRPYKNYSHLHDIAVQKGSGISKSVIASLNAVGAAAFADNPVDEDIVKSNLYQYLGIPAFDTRSISHRMKENMSTLENYDEIGTYIVMGMVKKMVKKETWARVEIVDSTGTGLSFFDPEMDIQKNKLYVFLIGNNSVIRAIDLDNEIDAFDDTVLDYLRKPFDPEIGPNEWKVLAAKKRVTKAGKNMAHVVFTNDNKDLLTLPVWPSKFDLARKKCKIGSVVFIEIGKMPDKSLFLKDVH